VPFPKSKIDRLARRVGAPQPKILSTFRDAEGKFHVIDEEGETVLEPGTGPDQHGQGYTFGVPNDWQGGTTEIRWHSDDDSGNNRSYVWVGLYAHTSGFTTYGNGWFNMVANGSGYTGGYVSIGSGWVLVAARDTWVGHDAAGALNMEVGVANGEVQGTSFNNVWGTNWVALTNYVVLPYAPFNLSVRASSVTTTSFGVEYTRSTYDTIDQDQAQWATDSGFSNVVSTTNPGGGGNGSAGYATPGVQLTPGTKHYFRVRSHNSRGWGPWSGTVSQATLPAVPPGLTVAANPSGTAATLSFTPPGGVSGVTQYAWERRITGTTTPVTTDDTNPATVTVSGLTPGTSYDWRGSAFIGTYESPKTGWITLVQPNPNVSPGDFFDGNTTDKPDIDYGWTGTVNNSTSRATGKGVTGWAAGTFISGAGSLYQTTGGFKGSFAARLAFTADVAAEGAWTAGMASSSASLAKAEEGALYIGSMYVNPSRSQRLQLAMYWRDAAFVTIGSTVLGPEVVVPGGQWTRLTVSEVAPAGAEYAFIRVRDVAGTGFVTFKSGEFILLDAAMVTLSNLFDYFDGSTPDTEQFTYSWEGATNASPSMRATNETVGAFDPLADPDCPPLPSPPRPPAVPSDCIDEVGTWRRYWASISEDVISDWMAVIPTLSITTGAEAARQVRIRVYENPDNLDPDTIDLSVWHSEQIVSYIPPNTVITLDGVSQRTWAEVDGGDSRPADKLLYGTGGTPATWPVLSCGQGYLLSFDAPLDAGPGNLTVALALTERMG
jgi:hypothetical protein